MNPANCLNMVYLPVYKMDSILFKYKTTRLLNHLFHYLIHRTFLLKISMFLSSFEGIMSIITVERGQLLTLNQAESQTHIRNYLHGTKSSFSGKFSNPWTICLHGI